MTEEGFDVERVRAQFPALSGGAAHFDGPGGTQTPAAVAHAIAGTLLAPLANVGTRTTAERNAAAAVTAGRAAMADLLGVSPDRVVFGRSMTQLTFDLSRTLGDTWAPGDEVVLTRLDHDANVRPWLIAARRVGATVRWVDFDPATGELASVADQVTERTRVVAVTAASNLIGTMPDVTAAAAAVHAVGGLCVVDGVHYSAHAVVDVDSMGVDVFACSPYKFLGPHCGVLTGRAEVLASLHPDKLLPSPDTVPERFELGTLPYELLAGTAAAVDVLADLVPGDGSRRERLIRSLTALEVHEERLRRRIEAGLGDLPAEVIGYSRARRRTPTLLVDVPGHDLPAVYDGLADRGVNAPVGSFYAYEASRRLGLGSTGALRIGLAPYTNDADVDRLLEALTDVLAC